MAKKVIDSRGSACPGPITDLALAYRNASIGDEIELWATDPGVKEDAKAWAQRTGNVIESITEQPDKIVVLIKIVKK
ncbi:MAG: sulfurtransferase TusA family protein [Candidatus Micrarchaeia archaeon]|jgi:TusA-related sulfurtransferase